MKKGIFTVAENKKIADSTFLMRMSGDTSGITLPGQFVNIALDGFYLRRPISVCDSEDGVLTVIYKAVGKGTEYMSGLTAGAELDILSGLGNGYDTLPSGKEPVLIGGGAGVPPLYMLAKALIKEGKQPYAVLGFNTSAEVFFAEEFERLGIPVTVTTADGTMGKKGFVTEALCRMDYSYYYTCGPEAMLRAVYETADGDGQLSFEERMGCGFGGCMGCTCKTIYGNKRICREGPVLKKEEVLWQIQE